MSVKDINIRIRYECVRCGNSVESVSRGAGAEGLATGEDLASKWLTTHASVCGGPITTGPQRSVRGPKNIPVKGQRRTKA